MNIRENLHVIILFVNIDIVSRYCLAETAAMDPSIFTPYSPPSSAPNELPLESKLSQYMVSR